MNWILVIRIVFLLLAVFFTSINVVRTYMKIDIPPMNFVYQSIGIVGFITSMGWI